MIFDFPFDVIFCPGYDSEIMIDTWKKKVSSRSTYYEAVYNSLKFALWPYAENKWYLKARNIGTEPVTGFVGIRFPWQYNENCYTLIPGIYYDGNHQPRLRTIPHIHLPEHPVFSASFSAASFPIVLAKESKRGYHYSISPQSSAGWNSVELNAEKATLTLFAPEREERLYHHNGFTELSRPPYTWQPEHIVTIRFGMEPFPCETVSDLFHYHWESAIRSELYPAHNQPKITEAQAAALVRDWVYEKHAVITPKGEPLILNAFTDIDGQWPHPGFAEWNIMIGWCSGSMTALPLLKFGGKYRDFAVTFLDFLSTHGASPSGVKYPVYDGEQWMAPGHPEYGEQYQHCRFFGDYLYYLGRAICYEREQGHEHPLWEQEFRKGLAILTDLWQRERDFGLYCNPEGPQVMVSVGGTAAGAFCLTALAQGARMYPEDQKILDVLQDACSVYYTRCVLTGRCNGGPVDILMADDSESIAALTNALVQQYQLTGHKEHLDMALKAAEIFTSWVVNYVPPFPGGTMLEGLNVCGGVLANVQNRHVGPGICTNSAKFIYDLGVITGDSRWTELYFRIKAAAINCVTSYDGEFCGLDFDQQFVKGMLSEQINVTNALNQSGETWRVSACWPATAVLLGWFDSP